MSETVTFTGVGDRVLGSVIGAPKPGGAGAGADRAAEFTAAEMTVLLTAQWQANIAAGDPDPEGEVDGWSVVAEVEELLAREAAEGDAGGTGVGLGAGAGAEELDHGLAAAGRGLGRAGLSPEDLVGIFDRGVVGGVEAVGRLRAQLDGVGVALAAEAHNRGLHTVLGLSLVDWLVVRCPWMSKQEANQVKDVVKAGETHWGKPLADAVTAGEVGVHRAAKVARTITRLASSLEVDQQQDYAQIVTDAAADPAISEADLGLACKKLLIDLLDEKPKESLKETAQELRCVTRRPLGKGMTRFTVDAPEVDAALIDGVLNGPLARPEPDTETGALDLRSAGQRKFDAFRTVFGRGMSNPGAPPSSARASVMVTVKANPVTGQPQGASFLSTGQVVDASQVGRLACMGDVTPIVLGEHGEPLNLGRTVRLATPGQFKALMVRDKQCTMPGCSVPGQWCESHHLIWWRRNGDTDIYLLVLLCPRHHTMVHEKDLMATVNGSNVTWHL